MQQTGIGVSLFVFIGVGAFAQLKPEPRKSPIELLVVDHAEKGPVEN